jgi:hypothetical protein
MDEQLGDRFDDPKARLRIERRVFDGGVAAVNVILWLTRNRLPGARSIMG